MTSCKRVEMLMGTAAIIDVRDAQEDANCLDHVINDAFARLREIEATFSTWRRDSTISRLGRGELRLEHCDDDVKFIVDLCEKLKGNTNGFFDAHAAAKQGPAVEHQQSDLPDARPIETSGAVKGWAIEQACDVLRAKGLLHFCVNIGGDLWANSDMSDGSLWSVGLQHPREHMKIMGELEVRDLAVATSGFYERGSHIVSPNENALGELLSVTVVGGDIALADAYATVAFAMGRAGIDWVAEQPGFEVFAATSDDQVLWSPGLGEFLVKD